MLHLSVVIFEVSHKNKIEVFSEHGDRPRGTPPSGELNTLEG